MHRRRLVRRVFPAFITLTLPLLAGCGEDKVEIIQGPGTDVGVSVQALSAADVTKVKLTVTGAGINTSIEKDLVKTNGQWWGNVTDIPRGSNRSFSAQAYDSTGKELLTGSAAGINVDGKTAGVVVIVLQPDPPLDMLLNHAPRINSLVASAGQAAPGTDVELTLAASDPDGDSLMYRWQEGAGTLVDSPLPDLTWTAPSMTGKYDLGVSITDDKGGEAGISLTLNVASSDSTAVKPSFNTWPVIMQVSADLEQLESGQTTKLNAVVIDADEDALALTWSDDCGGSFDDPQLMNPTWTAPNVAMDSACQLKLAPNDGRGGTTTASLSVNIIPPNLPPMVDKTYQSSESLNVGGTVHFRLNASDPENGALTFTWSATAGTLAVPTTSALQSDIDWIAPTTGGSYTVTGTVKDAKNKVVTYDFHVTVKDVMPPAMPVTLASGLVQPGAIASDGMDVYWLNGGSSDPMNPGGTVMKCSIEGCNGLPTILAHGQLGPSRIALDATTVYWTMTGSNGLGTDGGLRWCEKGGCFDMPAYLEGGQSNYGIAVYGNNLYWSIWNNGQTRIRTSSLIGMWSPQDLATFSGYAFDMAANATSLLWTQSHPSNALGQLSPPGPGSVAQLVSGQMNSPGAVAMDDKNVYWIGGDSIFKCALSGCGGTPTQLVSGLEIPAAIATDGINIYWTLTPMGPGAVMKCPVGGGMPTTMASGPDVFSPGAIAVDATSVYWSDFNTGTVTRMAK